MNLTLHAAALKIALGLYIVSTWTSMAGMEIFGWLTFVLAVSFYARSSFASSSESPSLRIKSIGDSMPWKACLLLLLVTAVGLILHRTEKTEFIQHFGSQRWMFLFFSTTLALAYQPLRLKRYPVFLFFISVIGLYAIFQSATGIDLLRPGSHRAVQPVGETAAGHIQLWRSAGLFGSPLGYAYIAGQHVCLALSMMLLVFSERLKRNFDSKLKPLFWPSLLAYVIVTASLVTTFTRGVWIAMAITHFALALAVSRRIALILLITGVASVAVLFTSVDSFRARALSLTDANYTSNSERVVLWRANWEMFKDYPLVGIGYQENENRAKEYVTRLGHPNAFTGHAHNNYLQMLSGTGIVGFLLWMYIITYMILLSWKVWRTLPEDLIWQRALALGSFGAQLTLHIGGFTECNFKAGATSHNLMLAWAIVASLAANYKISLRPLKIKNKDGDLPIAGGIPIG